MYKTFLSPKQQQKHIPSQIQHVQHSESDFSFHSILKNNLRNEILLDNLLPMYLKNHDNTFFKTGGTKKTS